MGPGETHWLDHEFFTAAALEQTGWGWGLEGQCSFQVAVQSRKECARLLAVRGHILLPLSAFFKKT